MNKFKGFHDFSLRSTSLANNERCWFTHFRVDGDFSGLFPFLQSTATDVVHYESPEYIQFQLDHIIFSLYPPDIVAARLFYGREQALEFARRLIEFLNEIEKNKSRIKPDFKKLCRLHVPDILGFLPLTNCGKCGFPTCMAFAGAVSRRRARLAQCQDFPDPVDARIIFSVNHQDPEKTRTIEVDSDLAGVVISRLGEAQNDTQRRSASKKQNKRALGVSGSRDGILFKLSGREAEGFTNKEIAQVLTVSQNTVKSHVVNIFNKLGVNDRTQAAVWASQNELI